MKDDWLIKADQNCETLINNTWNNGKIKREYKPFKQNIIVITKLIEQKERSFGIKLREREIKHALLELSAATGSSLVLYCFN